MGLQLFEECIAAIALAAIGYQMFLTFRMLRRLPAQEPRFDELRQRRAYGPRNFAVGMIAFQIIAFGMLLSILAGLARAASPPLHLVPVMLLVGIAWTAIASLQQRVLEIANGTRDAFGYALSTVTLVLAAIIACFVWAERM